MSCVLGRIECRRKFECNFPDNVCTHITYYNGIQIHIDIVFKFHTQLNSHQLGTTSLYIVKISLTQFIRTHGIIQIGLLILVRASLEHINKFIVFHLLGCCGQSRLSGGRNDECGSGCLEELFDGFATGCGESGGMCCASWGCAGCEGGCRCEWCDQGDWGLHCYIYMLCCVTYNEWYWRNNELLYSCNLVAMYRLSIPYRHRWVAVCVWRWKSEKMSHKIPHHYTADGQIQIGTVSSNVQNFLNCPKEIIPLFLLSCPRSLIHTKTYL